MNQNDATYLNAILAFIEPITQQAIKECTNCHKVEFDVHGGLLKVDLTFQFPYQWFVASLAESMQTSLKSSFPEIRQLDLSIDHDSPILSVGNEQAVANVKSIIAVASGKGGVGKSSTAVMLARALRENGASVGLLDADIYGPSVPIMTGLLGKPESPDGETIIPMLADGVEVMSIGLLVDESEAIIWRGPMATSALQQMLRETLWGHHQADGQLDYLILDLPPGTGDIQLTMAQKIPVNGAIIVTTPQDIALADVIRAIKMFEKVNIPVLGVVENMSTYICPACGHAEAIFGEGGAGKLEQTFATPLLAKLPLNATIRQTLDEGRSVIADSEHPELAREYLALAVRSMAALASQADAHPMTTPTITIE